MGVRTVDTVTRLQGSVSVCLSVFMLIPYRIRLWVSEQWTLSPGYRGVCLSVCLYLCSFLTEYDCGCQNSGHCHQVTGECVCLYLCSFLTEYDCGCQNSAHCHQVTGECVCPSVFMFIPYRIWLWVSEQWTLSPGYRGVCLSVCIYVNSLQNTTVGVRTVDTVTRLQGSVCVCRGTMASSVRTLTTAASIRIRPGSLHVGQEVIKLLFLFEK